MKILVYKKRKRECAQIRDTYLVGVLSYLQRLEVTDESEDPVHQMLRLVEMKEEGNRSNCGN